LQTTSRFFGEGLGLDSIDALELVVALEKEFGIKITSEEMGVAAFTSVSTLAAFRAREDGGWIMNSCAIYPGSFDPLTNGHLDLVQRATGLFQKVVVAVLKNTEKECLLTVEDRVKVIRESVATFPCVEVDSFDGLLVDYVRRSGARHILRESGL